MRVKATRKYITIHEITEADNPKKEKRQGKRNLANPEQLTQSFVELSEV